MAKPKSKELVAAEREIYTRIWLTGDAIALLDAPVVDFQAASRNLGMITDIAVERTSSGVKVIPRDKGVTFAHGFATHYALMNSQWQVLLACGELGTKGDVEPGGWVEMDPFPINMV